MATIIDGKELSKNLISLIKEQTLSLVNDHKIRPGLAVILVGQDPASQIYVNAKSKMAKECGFYSLQQNLPEKTSQAQLLKLIQKFNEDQHIHGILVQLPLPTHIDKTAVIQAINPEKDVDGFNYINVGKLATGDTVNGFVPCTPAGIMVMLKHYLKDDLSGLDAVIIGRSNIVGKPMAQLLVNANATVTIAHSKTRELEEVCLSADILIAATGKAHLIQGHWIKPGAAVIDVGINRILAPENQEKKYPIVGDVDFATACNNAGYITPVPGGVGPMTIAMLMGNTLKSACKTLKLPIPEF